MPRDRLADHLRVLVVFRKPVNVVLDRVQPGGREDAGLPHCAAPPLLEAPGVVDELLGPGQEATDGGTQALAQVHED